MAANGFSTLTFTQNGLNLLAKAQAGTQLSFTRVAVGDGILNGQDATKFTHLLNEVMSLNISKIVISSASATLSATLSNSSLTTGFYWREIGVFATDPQLGEILYAYANSGDGDIYVPDKNTSVFTAPCNIGVYISSASNVTAVIDSSIVFVTQKDIEDGTVIAGKAGKLATARTIYLTGNITGSASFDGSGDINISATVGDDSHKHTVSHITDFASGVLGAVLSGLSTATSAAISAADTIISAMGKLQAQITAHISDKTAHVVQLSCTKTGTVYALNGLTTSSGIIPCVFQAPAAYVAGDTFTVIIPPATAPTTLTIVTSGGEALRGGAFLSGDIIGVKLDPVAQKLYIRQDSASQAGAVQGNTKAWVATAAAWDPANLLYILTIPGFVYSDGCTITFKAPAAPPGSSVNLHEWCSIVINGTYYFLRTIAGNALSGSEWIANAEITVTLSPISIPLSTSSNRGTAFVGLSNYADYASGNVALTSPGLRNNTISSAAPSGGSDGDTWDQV